ncbi:MAG: methylated-DNA--[protein]-cysteine S-methyltransferase, partial [Flavobacteriales bacterium]|nr:methylated-DNA--[protein]-cysteine S-methyltransferase [Flavobacteriales bacterium]
ATEAGLVRVAFEAQGHDAALEDLARAVSPRVIRAPARLDEVRRELDQYFAGRRRQFDLPLDRRLSRGFRGRVQALLPAIPFGRTCSYGELAALAGSPRAVRAVGSACATNPLPIVVPCHRVRRSDGSLGGYAGGLDAKRALLALEGGP